jgi:GT2 family glycosyltransferase/glycosyltransferase involved in cell wall biosynthesis/tetratricopeptide (TPR) repeat protein
MSKRHKAGKSTVALKNVSAPPASPTAAKPETDPNHLHQVALECWSQGQDYQAIRILASLLVNHGTADVWVTWARLQEAFQRPAEAEAGLRRALELDPAHVGAVSSLGLLLERTGRPEEALKYLDQIALSTSVSLRERVIAAAARSRKALELRPRDHEVRLELEKLFACEDAPSRSSHVRRYAALLAMLPKARPGERLLALGNAARILEPVLRSLFEFDAYTLSDHFEAAFSEREAEPGDLSNAAAPKLFDHNPWPFPDGFFDFVLACDFLERIPTNPMVALSEINRVLRAQGSWFLSTPNSASYKSLQSITLRESPSVQEKFAPGPFATETCGREYSASDVQCLARSAGFAIKQCYSRDTYWAPRTQFIATLAAQCFPIGLRGDTLQLCAEKSGPVHDRRPARLFGAAQPGQDLGSRPLRILVAHERVPSPTHSGADKRVWQILRALRQLGHTVALVGLRETEKSKARAAVEVLGIEVRASDAQTLRFESNAYHNGFCLDQVLGDGQFDVALLSLWFWNKISVPELYLDEIRRLSPRTRVAIETADCHWLRQARSAEASGRWSDRERSLSLRHREEEIYRRADFVISISQDDKTNLEKQFPGIPVGVVPMCADPGSAGPGFQDRSGIAYMADYQNVASLDAIEWFLAEIWLRILERQQDVKLYLIGNGMPEGLGLGVQNVIRVGYVENLGQEFAKYRAFVCPMRWGTGIKTKNLSALSYGLPLVTTANGAEGMNLVHRESALIADTAEEFARAVSEVCTDQNLWESLSVRGRDHVATRFSEQGVRSALTESLERTLGREPKPYEAGHVWSYRLNELHSSSSFPGATPQGGILPWSVAHLELAEKLLATGQKAEARRQLSHIFSIVSFPAAADHFYRSYGPVVERMRRVLLGLGERDAVEAMRLEAWSAQQSASMLPPPRDRKTTVTAPSRVALKFSAIIPTHNRWRTLSDCLSALACQTLPADQFEVIVVDDGSNDDTESFCKGYKAPFAFQYLRQENAGAGAARRNGVDLARGKYLLLMNDDTIAAPELLSHHLAEHTRQQEAKTAVLGNFQYPAAAKRRALTHYLSVRPFLFPMMDMKPGRYADPMYFVTCNLSVPRQAVLDSGSFDPSLRVAEDTDLGIRLYQQGFEIVYAPEAKATHQHLDFRADDLLRRAWAYAPAQFRLLSKYPWMLGDGKTTYGRMDRAAALSLQGIVDKGRNSVPEALESIRRFDDIDFEKFWAASAGHKSIAEEIIHLFARAVPEIYFFYFYQRFLQVWQTDGSFPADCSKEDRVPSLAG